MQSLLPPKLELAFVTLLCIFSYQSVAQSTSVVSNNLNTGPGSLRNAIAEANADALSTPDKPHQITFDPTIGNTITISSPFLVVTNHVNIAGPGKSKLVISGGNTTRIFWLQNGNITISGLTLDKGYARGGNGGYAGGGGMGAGGAIFMHEGRQDPQSLGGIASGSLTVRLINVDFKNNRAVGGVGGFGWGHVNFEEDGGFFPLVGGGGGMGGNGGGVGEGMPGAGGGGGVIGNGGSDFGGSVTGANDFQPGTNGAITIFGSGGGANIPGFGGGGGYSSLAQTYDGNFGGGGSGDGGGGFGGGGGSGRDGGFGGGGGGGWTEGGFGGSYGKGLRQETEKGWDSGEGGDGMGAGGAIFVASGRLLLSHVSFKSNSTTAYSRWDDNVDGSYSMGLGGAIFIFNKQDNHGLPAPGTTNDPVVTSCGGLFFQNNNSSSDPNQPGINDDNQYGTISAGSTEFVRIVNEPEGQTVDAGSTVTASITTAGSVVSYQWYKDGVSLGSSQQTATLTLSNVTPADAGRYRVVVKGYCNSVDCSRFILKVNSCANISNGANELKLLVKPNPSNSYFTIIATSDKLNEKVLLKITNETGRVIEVKNTTVSKSLQIGGSYPPGLYMVQAIQGDKTATLKLIKQ